MYNDVETWRKSWTVRFMFYLAKPLNYPMM